MIDFNSLWNIHPETYGTIKILGKEISTPRWQQSYGRDYRFTGMNHAALPVPELLDPFLEWANSLGYGTFNQVLVNWYANGHHYIGKHRDSESQLVPQSPIISISLGATRTFRIRNYATNDIIMDLSVNNGDVVIMGGNFQSELTHEIPKISGMKGEGVGPRINITFRQFN
jgi:alkylated DNA repair dioxygenase AlkB